MDDNVASTIPTMTEAPRGAPLYAQEPSSTYKLSTIGVSILSFWIIFLTLLIAFLCWYLFRHRRRLILISPAVRRRRIERRYITAENWLITKRVYRHSDSFCQFCQDGCKATNSPKSDNADCSNAESKPEQNHAVNTTMETTSNAAQECSICFEEFQEGKIVSWSANPECPHVFCHVCIKEWLLRHSTCPSCRHVFLPTDYERGRIHKDQLKEMSEQWGNRCRSTFFCEMDGMIQVPLEYLGPKATMKRLQRRIVGTIVPSKELSTVGRQGEVVDVPDSNKEGGGDDYDPLAEPIERMDPCASPAAVTVEESNDTTGIATRSDHDEELGNSLEH